MLASLESQLEEFLGGRREQAAVAIQALMDVALDYRHLSLKLPERLTPSDVRKFLREAASKIDKEQDGVCSRPNLLSSGRCPHCRWLTFAGR